MLPGGRLPRSADALTWGPAARSSASSLGPLHDVTGIVVAVGYAVVTGLAPAALGVVALLSGRISRQDGRWWLLTLLVGATVAGSAAGALFVQPGGSEAYFPMSSLPLAALASAVGARALGPTRSLQPRTWWVVVSLSAIGAVATWTLPRTLTGAVQGLLTRIAVQALIAVALVALAATMARVLTGRRLAAVLCVAACGLGNAAVARAADISNTPLVRRMTYSIRQPGAVTTGQVSAARFIGARSGVDDLVMTNRHCSRPVPATAPCDSRRWVVAAFSGRQVLIEAWGTTPTSAKLRPHGRELLALPYWNPPLLRLNDDFFVRPTDTAQRALWKLGVRWLYVDRLLPHRTDLSPYAVLRYRNADASAYQLVPPAG